MTSPAYPSTQCDLRIGCGIRQVRDATSSARKVAADNGVGTVEREAGRRTLSASTAVSRLSFLLKGAVGKLCHQSAISASSSGCKPVNALVSDKDDRSHLPDGTRPHNLLSVHRDVLREGDNNCSVRTCADAQTAVVCNRRAAEAVIIQHGVEIVVLQQGAAERLESESSLSEAERLFPDSEPCALSASCSACTVAMG